MSCTIIYGGFNPAWKAGQLERHIVDTIASQLDQEHSQLQTVVAVSSWHEPSLLIQDIKNLNPDISVICSLSDPLGPIEKLLDTLPGQTIKFGYVDNGINFDFWALACVNFFRQYKNEELLPVDLKHIFLNYNRKPHRHRVELINLLEQHNLINYGINTLGNSNYTINDKHNDYLDFGGNDIVGDVGIPNDIYSLGRLDIWNSCFLNVVSETQYEYSPNIFISEKIYKPIIGLRPFIVNGSPGIYNYLKNIGFDCFEDIFPIEQFIKNNYNSGLKFKNHELIIDCIKSLLDADLNKLYKQLLPRLTKNQQIFYDHAKNQRYNIKL